MTHGPRPGDLFGRYRIERILGRGGMGAVYAATDTRLGRTVAVKVITGPLAADPEFVHRFHDEADVLGRLDSPFVIRILDHDTIDDLPYIVTQYVDGTDLDRHLQERGPLTVRDALRVCAQVARALGDAHRAGVVHRDVKPGNVLVRSLGTPDEHAYLCDFGIARADTTDGRTAVGMVAGTWTYLAPERTQGVPASPASDLYALGCLLWACLTGGPPYSGSDVEVAIAHAQAPVPQVPGTDAFTADLNAVLARLLAKDPADRYAEAGAARQDLARLVGDAPATALSLQGPTGTGLRRAVPEPPTAPAAARPAAPTAPPAPTVGAGRGRSRRLPLVAGAVALALTGGVGAWTLARGDDPAPKSEPPGKERRTTGDLDGDGYGDLAVLQLAARDLAPTATWTLDSDGERLGAPAEAAVSAPTAWDDGNGELSLADVDGDERPDQVWSTITPESVVVDVVPAEGEPWHEEWPNTGDDGWSTGTRPVLADLDQDGRDDLVLYNEYPFGATLSLDVAIAAEDGFADPASWFSEDDVDEVVMLSAGDFDGDGDDDLAAQRTRSDDDVDAAALQLFTSDGERLTPTGPQAHYDFEGYDLGVRLVADVDGDGADDAVLAGAEGLAAIGFPDGEATDERTLWPDPASGGTGSGWERRLRSDDRALTELWTAADVDGDRDDDLVFLRPGDDAFTIEVYVAEGGTLATPTVWGSLPCGGAAPLGCDDAVRAIPPVD